MNVGENYTITVEGNTNGTFESFFTVFFDWNQNGILGETGEYYVIGSITSSTGEDGQQASNTIQVPGSAMLGDTRMRVIKNFLNPANNACQNIDYGQIEDYTINVASTLPECDAPTDVVVSNLTETTADVSWTSNGDETEWEILYGLTGFDPETEGTSIIDSDAIGETLSGLTEDTTYEVYVRAICDAGFESDWTAAVEFTTDDLNVASQLFASFTYYPNPVQSTITLKSAMQIEQVSLYNLLGQQVLNTKPSSLEVQLQMDALPAGVYLMKVNIKGSEKTFRLIKE